MKNSSNINHALAESMHNKVRGEVYFDEGRCRLYATDSSNYRQLPIGVVIPDDTDDLKTALAVCRQHAAPVTMRGSGTGLAGQTTNRAVIIDVSRNLDKDIQIDPVRRLAHAGPGVVLDRLQEAAAKHGLRFGPDPSTHNNCTIGGMIGNNACGVRSVASSFEGLGARTSDNLAEMTIATINGDIMQVGPTSESELEQIITQGGTRGEIYQKLRDLRDRYSTHIRSRFPDIPRRVSGYNLDELLPENNFNVARALAGTEGTCVVYIAATLHLIPLPGHNALVVMGFEDVAKAADAVPAVLGFSPSGLEGMDQALVDLMGKQQLHPDSVSLLPRGKGWLLAEFGADSREAAEQRGHELCSAMKDHALECKVLMDPAGQERIWEAREGGLGSTAHVPRQKDAWEGWEDSAVPPERLGDYLRDFRALLERYQYTGPLYGHFGQGLVHTRISFDLKTGPGIQKFRQFIRDAADLVVAYGGSFSGEHGDGQAKAEMLERMFGTELLRAFSEFKSIWDPAGLMNPHKIVRPYRIDQNLRLGSSYQPASPHTFFKYPQDRGSMAYATERCVGVGNCRKTGDGTMCPSYMATKDEMHSTRGRTHLLFELLRNPHLRQKDWRDKTIKTSLDLCLACKACKTECPVNVDMATYKAEFMAQYYKGHLRPPAAYAMGLIMYWARLGSAFPRLTNRITHAPGLSAIAKHIAGIASQRSIPHFAPKTFRQLFSQRHDTAKSGPSVILWPDTFNNYFYPDTLTAAVSVLEHAGWQVRLPPENLCCGRPLYDFGMLHHARSLLRKNLAALQPAMAEGIPLVALEPSCLSVFRDEARNFFPGDERARRLEKQSFTFAEFLQQHAAQANLPKISRRVLVHIHCHQKSILDTEADKALLDRLGLDWTMPDSGCCGMAGSFGFEKDKYNVSETIARQRLLPAVQSMTEDTLLISDGFSCREQVRDFTGIRPRHLAELIAGSVTPSQSPPQP